MKIIIALFFLILLWVSGRTQQPRYTKKNFVSRPDTIEFKRSVTENLINTYIMGNVQLWDVDDIKTTHVRGGAYCLLNITGPVINGKREGVFSTYIIDSADHSMRYKIYEQVFKDDILDGEWRTFNLKGTLVMTSNFKNNTPFGLERTYWIDGKQVINEKEYLNGEEEFIERQFHNTGKLSAESHIKNMKYNGLCKEFYEDGSIKREAMFKDDVLDGVFKYYYPGGKLWIEQVFKNGKQWEVISNYSPDGKQREKGTLKNGNGTVYLYNEDGTIREIVTIVNGEEKN